MPWSGPWGLAWIQASLGCEAFLKPQTSAAAETPGPHVAPRAAILSPTLSVSRGKSVFPHSGPRARAMPLRTSEKHLAPHCRAGRLSWWDEL